MQANLPSLTTRSNHQPAKSGGGFLSWLGRREEQLAPTVEPGCEPRVVAKTTWARLLAYNLRACLVHALRAAGASDAYIAKAIKTITHTPSGRLRKSKRIASRMRALLLITLEARAYGRGRNRLSMRGIGTGALRCAAAGGPCAGRKLAGRDTITKITREFVRAGLIYQVQLPASKVPAWERGPYKRAYVLGPGGEKVWSKKQFSYNRYYLCFEDFERPEPEPSEYLEAAVVAELATTAEEAAFLAELDDILANARPRETLCWPAGDVEPPKGGRGPPN